MSIRVTILVVTLVGAAVCGLMSTFTNYDMMDGVNAEPNLGEGIVVTAVAS
jgi:hypothetical protein